MLALATQHKEKVHKQDEIDMTNANPNANLSNVTIFHQLCWTLRWVLWALHWALWDSLRVLGYQRVGIGNTKVSCWGLYQSECPTQTHLHSGGI